MADDKSMTGQADRSRINIHEDYEVRHWTEKFGVTAEELRGAVANVGVMADDVERYLNSKR